MSHLAASSFWSLLLRRVMQCLWCLGLLLGWMQAARAAEFLEPEQAFQVQLLSVEANEAVLGFRIAPGYYLYRERFEFSAEGASLGVPAIPKGKVKFDETFQKEVETHRGDLRVSLPVEGLQTGAMLVVGFQGCADAGLCYPPQTQKLALRPAATSGVGEGAGPRRLIDLSAPRAVEAAEPSGALAGSLSDAGAVERLLRAGASWTTLGAFALMGLLLSFTPCVLPMLPILSSVIAGGGPVGRGRGLALAAAYALGMALVYTALGVAAGLLGEGLAAALQKPWVLAVFAALLSLLSLSMFDVFELSLPSALANRLDGAARRLPGGRFLGVFLMGALSALIVSPCVTGPLAGALIYLSQTGDVVLAGAALFMLALGMSVPLLLLGASAGAWLPRSGTWMHAVKRFFGLLLLGVALWTLQPVLPAPLALLGWAALCLLAGYLLRPFDPHPHSGAPRVALQRAAGLAALAFGVMQLVGAASGAHDPLQPLGALARPARAPAPAVVFEPVRSLAELQARVAQAGRPVMLDFYADWCVSCKEMERYTFSDPAVARRLAGALLLKADVTANTEDDKALLKHFRLFGPPGTIFFDAQGVELQGLRVIGYRAAEDFEKTLVRAGL